MHGGIRDGAGRKTSTNKKKAVTIYLNDYEIEAIENIPLPKQKTFSKKCRELISVGINYKSIWKYWKYY